MLKFGGLVNLRSKDTLYDRALGWRKQQEEDGIDINTLETQRYHIEVSIAPGALGEKLGRTNVVDLTVDDFNMLWRTLARNGGKRGNGLGLSALKHIRSTLGQILRKAEQQGKIRQNVVYLSNTIEDLPVGVVRQPKETRAPDEDQFEAILALAAEEEPLVEQLLIVGAHLGTRVGELLGARWVDVDWDTGILRLEVSVRRDRSYVFTDGTRTEEKVVPGSRLKTKESTRPMELTDDAVDALKRRRADAEEQGTAGVTAKNPHGLIFLNDRNLPFTAGRLSERIDKLLAALDVGHWSLTELARHNFATQIAHARDEHGRTLVPAEDLAYLLGHRHGDPGRRASTTSTSRS